MSEAAFSRSQSGVGRDRLSESGLMDLRMALVRYRLDADLSETFTWAKFAKEVGIGNYNYITRFINGTHGEISDASKIIQYLEAKGYWPPVNMKRLSSEIFMDMLGNATASDRKSIGNFKGIFEAHHWSSTNPGAVSVSNFSIDNVPGDIDICEVKEFQYVNGQIMESIGVLTMNSGKAVMLVNDGEQHIPKMIVWDKIGSNVSGLYIEVGREKKVHVSPIVMMKLEVADYGINPREIFIDDISDYGKKIILLEPVTQGNRFRLTAVSVG